MQVPSQVQEQPSLLGPAGVAVDIYCLSACLHSLAQHWCCQSLPGARGCPIPAPVQDQHTTATRLGVPRGDRSPSSAMRADFAPKWRRSAHKSRLWCGSGAHPQQSCRSDAHRQCLKPQTSAGAWAGALWAKQYILFVP